MFSESSLSTEQSYVVHVRVSGPMLEFPWGGGRGWSWAVGGVQGLGINSNPFKISVASHSLFIVSSLNRITETDVIMKLEKRRAANCKLGLVESIQLKNISYLL